MRWQSLDRRPWPLATRANTQMLGVRQTRTAQTQTTRSIHRAKSWEGELTMACMFNRNLFICLNRRQKNERGEKKKQHKNGWTTCYANESYTKQKMKINTSSSIWINSYKHGRQSKISPKTPHIQICENGSGPERCLHEKSAQFRLTLTVNVCPKWNDLIPLILQTLDALLHQQC